MQLVATSKLRKMRNLLEQQKPFYTELTKVVSDILSNCDVSSHPYIQTNKNPNSAIILITSSLGLCGGYNSNAIKCAKEHIKENDVVDVLFTLDINSFNNVESPQMIIQDIKVSEEYLSYFENENRIFLSARAGEKFSDEDIIPTRDDFAVVYSLLRREFRTGNDMMTEIEIYHRLSNINGADIRLAKLKIILEVLNELKICTVEQVSPGIYQYDIYFNSEKTSIEKSSILKKLKSQCTKK
jgi:hypothetical protein